MTHIRELGRFVVLEGIDGSGSTTQAKRLVQRLVQSGIAAVFTCEPSDGNVGSLIRSALAHRLQDAAGRPVALDWATLALLFAADRADHVHRCVQPELERGTWVISDRYDLSSLAYQSVTSESERGADALPWIRQLNRQVRRPDLTLVVDVTADTAAQRRQSRGGQAELFEVPELQRRLARVYGGAESLVPDDPLVHVDGERSVEEVSDQIWSAVQHLFLPPGGAPSPSSGRDGR